jgi:hypothetical protein
MRSGGGAVHKHTVPALETGDGGFSGRMNDHKRPWLNPATADIKEATSIRWAVSEGWHASRKLQAKSNMRTDRPQRRGYDQRVERVRL